ncbi:C40 family peptidase [Paenibacillus sp.]|uniref:C40 family peptidase n=1 Tax=Paenibacillus sp. TaxID=58172 RepID=UPI002D6BFE74|nr:C40 family peptidase [Paenibacillus sp.]HZG87144.1 C40 family peptidase [Paenibacillus sp.]
MIKARARFSIAIAILCAALAACGQQPQTGANQARDGQNTAQLDQANRGGGARMQQVDGGGAQAQRGGMAQQQTDGDVSLFAVNDGRREAVINAGKKYMGRPYEFGSSRTSTRTFDCSDFVRQAYLEGVKIKLPGDSRSQAAYAKSNGRIVRRWQDLKPGDIMFFMSYRGSKASNYKGIDKMKQRVTHDGIYLGNGKVLHTYSKESGGVRIDDFRGRHWEYRFLYGGSILK